MFDFGKMIRSFFGWRDDEEEKRRKEEEEKKIKEQIAKEKEDGEKI